MQLKCIQCGHVFQSSSADQCPSCHRRVYRPYPYVDNTTNDNALFTTLLIMSASDSPSYDYDSSSDSSSSCDSSSD